MFRMSSLCRIVSAAALIAVGMTATSAAPAPTSAAPATSTPAAPAAESQRLLYRVQHSTYGTIGTYSNSIQRTGDTTVVTTQGQLRVAILGIVMYRQDLSRTERWNGDRLISFRGVTTVNDRTMEVTGEAEGDKFVVMSPSGDQAVPGTVRLANPWSKDVLKGNIMLTPDRGALEEVTIGSSEDTTVKLDRGSVPARHYRIERSDGMKSYDIWLDKAGTPVQFAVNNPNGVVTFTLTKG